VGEKRREARIMRRSKGRGERITLRGLSPYRIRLFLLRKIKADSLKALGGNLLKETKNQKKTVGRRK